MNEILVTPFLQSLFTSIKFKINKKSIDRFFFHLVFYQYLLDDDEEVRTNACFGMGVLCVAANQQLIGQYQVILNRLSQVLSKETNIRMIDNICSCLCRMIVVSPTNVPLGQVYDFQRRYFIL